jgi:hydroxyacylglutathione hydrolase
MLLRPFLNDSSACASYLFGCGTHGKLAVVDPHADLVDDYLATAEVLGAPIVAVFETHLQADHLSGLPALRERTGATAYLPLEAGVEFEHVALADGDLVELGNTLVTAIATPGHAPAHHAYAVADRRRNTEEPWLLFSGDSLLIGDVGRPDLHVRGDALAQARLLHASLRRLLELPDHVVLYPSHYGGSVCGRALSGNPVSSIGFERAHNPLLAIGTADAFAEALVADAPPPPLGQEQIVAANRSGTAPVTAPVTA